MKYRNTFRPAACAGKASASNRYTIDGAAVVEYDGRKFLAATDGMVLSFVPVELDDDDKPEGPYPVAAFQAATKAAGRSGEARMTVNGAAKVTAPDGSVATFPKLDSRFPDVAGIVPTNVPAARIGVNVRLLAKLADALGVDAVELAIDDDSMPIKVRPIAEARIGPGGLVFGDGFGVIMPISVKG